MPALRPIAYEGRHVGIVYELRGHLMKLPFKSRHAVLIVVLLGCTAMNLRTLITFAMCAVLVLSGCASGGNGDPDGPGGPGQPPATNPFTGRLVGHGTGGMHTMNLTANGEWVQQTSVSNYARPALRLDANELYLARINMATPMSINIYDLNTFGQKDTGFIWPATDQLSRVHGLAVAPGGRYLAAVLSGLGDQFLEILDTQTMEIVFTGFNATVDSNMLWTQDLELVFAMNFQGQGPEGAYGGIVAVPLQEFLDGDDQFDLEVLVSLTQQQWGIAGIDDIALSHDGTQLAFVRSGDIWAKDLTTDEALRQLTVGPTANWGPAFSPDGSLIAFVGARGGELRDTLVVRNDDGGPYMVSTNDHSLTEVFLVDRRYLVEEIMAWLP